ncbi:MAG: QueT transporter family protein [Clostridiales bacterium]|nr:QueT transporter family protein [Clostridiales bacterium]
MNQNTRNLTTAALTAALYVVLTFVANAFGLASGVIQVRLSEALTILPLFSAAAIPGLAAGCLLANFLTGCALWDVLFGTLATLLGALGTRYLSRRNKWIAPIFPILSNAVIVPWVLQYAYGVPDGYWFLFATVGIGEVISCGVLGLLTHRLVERTRIFA